MSLENMNTTEVAENVIERFHQTYSSQKSESTADRYATHLERWRDWLNARGKAIDNVANDVTDLPNETGGVTAGDVEDHLDEMYASGYAENTANGARAAISAFYQTLRQFKNNPADADHINRSWSSTTQIKKETRSPVKYLPPEEVEALINHVPSPVPRNSLLIRLLYTTGMRRGELCNLRVKDVDRENQTITIWTEKSGDSRKVPYPNSLRQQLANWIDVSRGMIHQSEESEYLFPTKQADKISGETVRYVVTQAAEEAGIQEVYGQDVEGRDRALITPHTLRHSYAVQAAKNGMRAPFLRDLLGHHDINVTEIYLQIASEDAVDAGREFGPTV